MIFIAAVTYQRLLDVNRTEAVQSLSKLFCTLDNSISILLDSQVLITSHWWIAIKVRHQNSLTAQS